MSIHEPIELPESEGGGTVYGAPPRLYHYTTQEGLLGIIRKGKLWLSSAHYLSDAKEIEHAVELAEERLEIFWNRFEPRHPDIDDDEELLRGLARQVRDVRRSPLYVFSMSVDGNLLSQWRAYCPDSGGYSIGFSTSRLEQLAKVHGFELVQCVYQEDHQRQVIDELIEETVGTYQEKRDQGEPVSSELWRGLELEFLTRFYRHAAAFKDPAFKEEQEFRLVSDPLSSTGGDVKYRKGPSNPIPYLEFELREKETNRLPISRIWVGPTPNEKLAMRIVGDLVNRYALGAEVLYSDIPYRTW